MSTSAAIGIKLPDGTVRAIRLNWDGYVAHAGAILGGWCKTTEAVNDLIALGDLSEINETLETCVAYHRDRREQYRLPRTFASVEDYQYCGMGQINANYLYIFDDGVWYIYGLDRTSDWIGSNKKYGGTVICTMGKRNCRKCTEQYLHCLYLKMCHRFR